MASFRFEFEWDQSKARANSSKHGVHFEQAAEVFRDPLALTIRDEEHSMHESRWITMGKDGRGLTILVVHTYERLDDESARVRIISARRPTRSEMLAYEEQQ